MTPEELDRSTVKELTVYMDLLGHDVLNNNQAVLSYLELIMATPGIDPKAKKYAERASSQIRSSSVLLENVKKITKAKLEPQKAVSTDLLESIQWARDVIGRLFPEKRLTVQVESHSKKVSVLANELLDDLLLNLFLNMAQLDPGDDMMIAIRIAETPVKGKKMVKVTVEDKKAVMPPTLDLERVSGLLPTQDVSRIVKMVGLLFAKMMADTMEAGLEVERKADEKGPGCVFALVLRRAGV